MRRCSAASRTPCRSCSARRGRCACSPTTCSSTPSRCCAASPPIRRSLRPAEARMMRRLPSSRRLDFCRRASAGALSALLAACGSAPVTHWHSLMPEAVPAAGAIAPAPAKEPIVVELEAVRLPTQVDQPQWLVRLPDGSLAVLEQERWASSLRDELRDALLETLIVRLDDAVADDQG